MDVRIQLPQPGDTVHARLGDNHIAFVELSYDEDASNPLTDCDGSGRIISFHSRHTSYVPPEQREEDPDRVSLSYFEHGSCRWGVGGSMSSVADFCWDGVERAGLWYPDGILRAAADQLELTGDARRDWMQKQAGADCESYTAWCNGQVYCARVSVYQIRHAGVGGSYFDKEEDYRFDSGITCETCGGLYAKSSAAEFVQDHLRATLNELGIPLEPEVVDG